MPSFSVPAVSRYRSASGREASESRRTTRKKCLSRGSAAVPDSHRRPPKASFFRLTSENVWQRFGSAHCSPARVEGARARLPPKKPSRRRSPAACRNRSKPPRPPRSAKPSAARRRRCRPWPRPVRGSCFPGRPGLKSRQRRGLFSFGKIQSRRPKKEQGRLAKFPKERKTLAVTAWRILAI